MKSILIPYKNIEIEVKIPKRNFLGSFPPRHIPGVDDEYKAIKESIRKPIGSKPLHELAGGKRDAIIVTSDITRPTKDHVIVPVILDELNHAGIPDNKIKVIIARGQHRKMSKDEIVAKLGREVVDRVRVTQHDPDNNLIYLGDTERGNKIFVNREVAQADLKISTGNIVPHRYAGFGGGAKSILPGVSGRSTIFTNHLYIKSGETGVGKLKGNPVREEMEEVARMVGLDFIVNTVMNAENEILRVFSGNFLEAHRAGVEYAVEVFGVALPSKADVVIANAKPMDIDFYQASKALEIAESAVKNGGTIIMSSPCYEGVGKEEFVDFLSIEDPNQILESLNERGNVNLVVGVVAYLIAEIREKAEIIVVSDGLSKETVRKMRFKPSRSIQKALNNVLKQKPDAKVAVFPYAPVTLPLI